MKRKKRKRKKNLWITILQRATRLLVMPYRRVNRQRIKEIGHLMNHKDIRSSTNQNKSQECHQVQKEIYLLQFQLLTISSLVCFRREKKQSEFNKNEKKCTDHQIIFWKDLLSKWQHKVEKQTYSSAQTYGIRRERKS